jgi:hypothetical protein
MLICYIWLDEHNFEWEPRTPDFQKRTAKNYPHWPLIADSLIFDPFLAGLIKNTI